MRVGSRLFRNAAMLTATGAAAKILFLLTSILIYRNVPKEQVGVLFTGMAFAITALLVSELGLRGYMVRELALIRDDAAASRSTFRSLLTARLGLMAISLPLMILTLVAAQYSTVIIWCATGLWIYAAFESLAFFFKAALRSYERMEYDAVFSFVGRGIVLGIVWLFSIYGQLTLELLIAAFAIGPPIEVAGLVLIIWRRSPLSLRPDFTFDRIGSLLRVSAPFAVVIICATLYVRTGTFVLSRIEELVSTFGNMLPDAHTRTANSDVAVAEYNAAGRIPDALSFLPLAIVNALLPFLTRNRGNSVIINTYFNLILKYLGLFGIAVSGFILLEPITVIRAMAGDQYLNAVRAFQIYGATVFFSFLQYAMANLLICMNQEKRLMRRYAIALITNITLSLFLAPAYGVPGAAAAYLLSEMLAAALDLWLLRQVGFRIAPRTLAMWTLPALALLLTTRVAGIEQPMVRGMVAIIATTAVISALGYNDWRRLRISGATQTQSN